MIIRVLGRAMLAASLLLCITGPSNAAGWELEGAWRLDVTCRNYTQVNNVTIGRADASTVIGTTNVGDGFGKIVDGAFDGENFAFSNKYTYDGRTYTETWRGRLSNGGRSMSGKFETNTKQAGGCSFRGRRV
jgi:hypothetical protein